MVPETELKAFFIEYSDGAVDKLVVDKRELTSGHISKIIKEADKIIQKHEQYGN